MNDIVLWDDNPSTVDLLGFDAVVAPVLQAIAAPELDPVTIGIHGPWGGGKSTVLGLVADAIKDDKSYVVVRIDPWEYDDHQDVKGAVIAEVLGALDAYFGDEATLTEKTKGLLKRISWSRVGIALANGAIRMKWDAEELIEAFTPQTKQSPTSMTGFRGDFADLLSSLPTLKRVVVLVDDLDRCLPEAVTGSLEAIKLFLSVPKMVFVLAADQDLVRDAIAVSLDSASRGDRFAARYLEKIIQLPVSLPRLAPSEAEAYTTLLLARASCGIADDYDALVAHCRERRQQRKAPLIGDLGGLPWQPDASLVLLGAQLAQGLGADRSSNPREIKRFLNAFGVRQHIAEARGIEVSADVIGKILLLEDRYRDAFDALAMTPEGERSQLLKDWEAWARSDEGHDSPPDRISEATRVWATADPLLGEVDVAPYITLAATLVSSSLGVDLNDDLTQIVNRLLGASDADRGLAQSDLAARPVSDRRQVVLSLLARARRLVEVTVAVDALIGVAMKTSELAPDIAEGIRQDCWRRLEPASVAALHSSGVEILEALVPALAADEDLDADVREAARQVLED